ncbi:MAG: DUF4365 domain-containing protein [Candidatus Hodarchaeota archaeon]
MSKIPDSKWIEFLGVNAFEKACINLKLLWRLEQPDTGFDGYVEITKDNLCTTNLAKIQVKSGEYYFRREGDLNFKYYPKKKSSVKYWSQSRIPVYLIFYSPNLDKLYWHYLDDQQFWEFLEGNRKYFEISKLNIVDKSFRDHLFNLYYQTDDIRRYVISFGINTEDSRELAPLLPPEIYKEVIQPFPYGYHTLCSWLEEELFHSLRLHRSIDFHFSEPPERSGEGISARIVVSGNVEQFINDFKKFNTWWEILEVATYETIYPSEDF